MINKKLLFMLNSIWFFSFFNFSFLLFCQYSYIYIQMLTMLHINQWENEIYLLCGLMVGFAYYFIVPATFQNFISFNKYVLNMFISYLCLLFFELWSNWMLDFFLFSSMFVCSIGELLMMIFISIWILMSLKMLLLNMQMLEIFYIELIFSFSFFGWLCLISIMTNNFFLVLYIFELVTILVVISLLVYLKIFGYKLVQASIQFFVLNLIFSAIYIFSLSLMYLYTGGAGNFTYNYILLMIYNFFEIFGDIKLFNFLFFTLGLKFCCMLMLLIFIFKLTLAPFSIWIIQVYNYIPYFVLMMLMTIYKIIYMLMLIRIMIFFYDIDFFLNFLLIDFHMMNFLMMFIIPSFFIGCLSYNIQNIKMILALTTISQFGYIFLGLLPGTLLSLKLLFMYMLVYSGQIYMFLYILMKYQRMMMMTQISHLGFIKYMNKLDYINLLIICLVFIGLPPFSGFFIKYFLFLEIFNSGFYMFVLLALLSNFLLSPIYLNIILQLMMNCNFQFNNLKLKNNWQFLVFVNNISMVEIFMIMFNCLFIFIMNFLLEIIFIFIEFFI